MRNEYADIYVMLMMSPRINHTIDAGEKVCNGQM